MGIEDTFNGAKAAMTFYNAYVNAAAKEIGMERALNLQTKMAETMGVRQGKIMKEQAGGEEIDVKTAFSLVNRVPESLGITSEVVEESPQSIVFKIGKCPIYEAGQMLGADAKTIETGCRSGPARLLDTMTKQLNPNLSYQLRKFRSAADDFCEEAIVRD